MRAVAGVIAESRIPSPVARYNVENYTTANGTTFPQGLTGSTWPNGTLNLGTSNVLTTTAPRYITISALPPNFPSQTGNLHVGSSVTFRSVEMWVRLTRSVAAGQYFFDFRNGAASGFAIGASSGDGNVGANIVGTTYYNNTVAGTWTATTNFVPILFNTGWRQFVLVLGSNVTDAPTLFSRFDSGDANQFVQGTPIDFADVAYYSEALTARQVKALYNLKCSRYSLSPIA
jgi:hypothetical protein